MWIPKEEQPGDTPGRASTNSEVVLMDGHSLATSAAPPTVGNLSVNKSSRVHIGPKFVSVTQNLQNTEVVKGRFLGLELVSSIRARRLRCSVAVFVCWAFLVASGLAIYLICVAFPRQQTRLDIGLKEKWYLRRAEWQAMPSYGIDFLNLPLPYVIIGHAAANYCNQKYSCIEQMLVIQQDHLRRGYYDIGPNFLVGGNGYLFEGRGANVFGAMVASWNVKSITIMFMGNYVSDMPDQAQFDHINVLLDVLVKEQVLQSDYTLYGQCQVQPDTISPGRHVLERMNNFAHWNSLNINMSFPRYMWHIVKNSSKAERLSCLAALVLLVTCALIVYFTIQAQNTPDDFVDVAPHEWNITRKMWLAQPYISNDTTERFEPLKLVIIQHTVSSQCKRFIVCAAELRNMQSWFIKYYNYDIPYNFLIGNDGRVYEGRGWSIEGAHTFGYNRCSMGIGFIGDYREELTVHAQVTKLQLERAQMLLEEGVRLGYLAPDYSVLGAKDVQSSASPGSNLYNAIRKWKHYDHVNPWRNSTCEKMHGLPPRILL